MKIRDMTPEHRTEMLEAVTVHIKALGVTEAFDVFVVVSGPALPDGGNDVGWSGSVPPAILGNIAARLSQLVDAPMVTERIQ